MKGLNEARAAAGLVPKQCAPDCPCACHGEAEDPGPHLATCALADPDHGDPIMPAPSHECITCESEAPAVGRVHLTFGNDPWRVVCVPINHPLMLSLPGHGRPFDPSDDRPWFLTLTGRQFFYDAPSAYPYTIEEIAHALGMICRFNAHLPAFYSVAEHSVHVLTAVRAAFANEMKNAMLPRRWQELMTLFRAALLHDASEAFMQDLPRPLKHMPELAGYREIEARVELAIFNHWDLEAFHGDPRIKAADNAVLRAEKEQLRGSHGFRDRDRKVTAADVKILRLSPEAASALFLEEWRGLGGQP